MKYFFIIISLGFLSSCSDSKLESVQLVSDEAVVKPFEDIMIGCVVHQGIQISEGKIIILKNCGDYPIRIIDLVAGEEHWVGSFGDGPGEVGNHNGFPSHTLEKGTLAKVIDYSKRIIYGLIKTNEGFSILKERDFPPVITSWKDIIELVDGSIIYNSVGELYNISKYMPNGEELFVMDFQPDIGSPNQGMDKAYDYYNDMIINPLTGKIIQVLQNFPYMIAYDQQLQLLEIKKTREEVPKPDWSIKGNRKYDPIPRYATQVLSGPNYYYVMNPEVNQEQTYGNNQYSPSLDIYNWEMELVASLNLDKPIFHSNIDFENKKIYGITFGSDDMVLGEVSIPASLHRFF